MPYDTPTLALRFVRAARAVGIRAVDQIDLVRRLQQHVLCVHIRSLDRHVPLARVLVARRDERGRAARLHAAAVVLPAVLGERRLAVRGTETQFDLRLRLAVRIVQRLGHIARRADQISHAAGRGERMQRGGT